MWTRSKTITIDVGETSLELGGAVRYQPGWIAAATASELLRTLIASSGWEQGAICMFGKEVLEPRLTAWVGDADYTYSGRTVRARPRARPLEELRRRIEDELSRTFNAVLLNLYRDGRDSMGLHADDEPELGPDPVIASVSLGAPRRFILLPKRKSAQRMSTRYEIRLGHGSLLVMGGACQHTYRHGIPKEPACTEPRLNLTFRYVHVT